MKRTRQKIIVFLLASFLNFPPLLAQVGSPCSTDEVIRKRYERNPESRNRAQAFEQVTKDYIKRKRNQSSKGIQSSITKSNHTRYTIPLVVHVYGEDFYGYSVTEEKVREAIRQVNIDFAGQNTDFNDVSNEFWNDRGTLDISFELATIDPNGNATTGVLFYPEASGFGEDYIYDEQIRRYAWDNYKYMNLYIQLDIKGDGTTNRSGVAWYPNESDSDEGTARVVMNGRYIWGNDDNGDGTEFYAYLTHEFGHWLNLIHTFGDSGSCSSDEVADTPATMANYDCFDGLEESCSGAGIPNVENYMDYSSCKMMFTRGQVDRMEAALETHPARYPIWQEDNLRDTGVGGYEIGAHLLAASTYLKEGNANNGSFEETITITAEDGASFGRISGYYTQGSDFTVSGLPSGLSVSIRAESSLEVTVFIDGQANYHRASDSDLVTITFDDGVVSGQLHSYSIAFNLEFLDPFEIVYRDFRTDPYANEDIIFKPFDIDLVGNASFGLLVDPEDEGVMLFESFGLPVISQEVIQDVRYDILRLDYGDNISASSSWEDNISSWDLMSELRSPQHTDWDNRTGYIGFQTKNAYGEVIYGWMRGSYSTSDHRFTLHDYAYNTEPNGAIYAGETGQNGAIGLSYYIFYEDADNSGRMENTITIEALDGTQFSRSSGSFSQGQDFSISGLPSGLSASLTLNGSNSATLRLNGEAANHYHSDDIDREIFLEFYSSAFNGNASDVTSSTYELSIDFRDPDEVIRNDFANITVDTPDTYDYERIYIDGLGYDYQSNSYQLWYYYEGNRNFRIDTWRKPLVCEPNSKNISYLQYDEEIGASNNWVTGYRDDLTLVLRSDSYTDWEGEDGYVGVVAFDQHGRRYYGWIRVSVSSTGSYATMYELGYNTKPYQSVYAGTTDSGGTTNPLNASFSANTTNVTPGSSVSFTDQSTGNPSDWYWEFEGGSPSTSTSENPTVTYDNEGAFNVTLTVISGNDSDVQTQMNFITVEAGGGNDSYCSSSGDNSVSEYISSVEVGSFYHSSGGDNYSHYTGQSIPLTVGENTSLAINTYVAANYTEYIKVWIDFDRDDNFETSELIYENVIQGQQNMTTNFTTPSNAMVGETRMRISMAADNEQSSACDNFSYGEVEDYTVVIDDGDGGGNPPTGDYCAASGGGTYEWISRVQVGSFTNTSTSNNGGYSDFTNQMINLDENSNSTIALTPSYSGTAYRQHFIVWIDYNQDNDFADANELVFQASGVNSKISGSISVPSSALSGNTRMRIAMKGDGNAPGPCDTYGYGEIEDYTVNIGGSDGGGTPPGQSEYCVSSATNSANEWIAEVSVGNFNYASGGADYSDHTNQTVNLDAGSRTNISVSPGMDGGPWDEYIRLWIDYNQDGVFATNEMVFEGISENAVAVNGNFTVSSNAQNGTTRMRVSLKGDGGAYDDPCESFDYGEVEDYSVNISGGVNGVVSQSNESDGSDPVNQIQSQITLAPNPVTNGVLNVMVNSENGSVTMLRVMNNVGSLVYEQSVSLQGGQNMVLPLTGMSAGLYYLQTIGESGISIHKFLIQ
ncbi:GEVED domain-containing protein [Xanthovirga aplysinae]|uniref:GEVED domain-containing protein n=1 Tax=Xanthovirga aplysinae TaxID=2529853 RepID=UPI0012BC4075|nr:GEVED domain-containing protein [Xanthovirga aplysinae]MTI33402.1 PKD domain-containing protein [Xanthovirga aplysinae]